MTLTQPLPVWARWLAVVLLVVAAASAGRFTAPLQVEERTVVQVHEHEKIVEKRVEVAAKVETRIVYRDAITKPDGTVEVHEVEKTGINLTFASTNVRTEDREVEKKVEVEKVTTLRPDWRVHLLVGASYPKPALELAGPLVLGAQVDRRIIGGVSVGVWGTTAGAAGASVSLEW